MSGLSAKARALVDAAQFVDEPSAADFDRVRAAITARIAIGTAAGAVVLLSADAASALAAPVANGVANGAVAAASAASVAPSAQAIVAATSVVAGAAPAAGGGAVALGITSTATIAAKVTAWVVAVALTGGAVGLTAKHVVGSGSPSPAVQANLPNAARGEGASVGLPTAAIRTGSASVSERRAPALPSGASQPAASVYAPHPAREIRVHAEAPTTASDVSAGVREDPAPSNIAATLDAELALIRRARAALNDGRPEEALAALDEHASRFPSGVLAEDRAAQRILALCALARPDAAREEGQRFFLDYPRSPHVAAIRGSCAFSSRPFGGLHE
jgi:hypothetical protein